MAPLTEAQLTRTAWSSLGPGRKELRYLELVDVGLGGWQQVVTKTRTLVAQLAKAKARAPPLQKRAEQAWRMQWGAILSCATAKAVATWTTATLGWHVHDFDWCSVSFSSKKKKRFVTFTLQLCGDSEVAGSR